MTKDEEMQKKIMQFQILQSTLQSIHEREEFVTRHLDELHKTKNAIDELTCTGDALVPIGAGNFVPGKITDVKNIITGVGGGVAIKKTKEEAQEFLDERIKDIESHLEELENQKQEIVLQLQSLQSEIEKMQRK